MTFNKRIARLATTLSLAAVVGGLAACAGTETATETTEPAATEEASAEGSDLEGAIAIDGSSTVFPISEAMAEEFQIANPGVRVTVGASGTGGGFQKFCAGETQISNASREVKPQPLQA
ncbi:MAG: substrate-binding domain-containing protein [Cyanobacteria bacterium J06626_14]